MKSPSLALYRRGPLSALHVSQLVNTSLLIGMKHNYVYHYLILHSTSWTHRQFGEKNYAENIED